MSGFVKGGVLGLMIGLGVMMTPEAQCMERRVCREALRMKRKMMHR